MNLLVNMLYLRELSVKLPTSLDLRREVWAGDIDWGVINILVVVEAMGTDKIVEDQCVN